MHTDSTRRLSPSPGRRSPRSPLSRRAFLGATVASTTIAPMLAAAQQTNLPPYEPRDWSGRSPLHYPAGIAHRGR